MLVILTAQHHLYEFDLLQCRLSDWSKRNPFSKFPEQFREIRDRAVGCLLHENSRWQRLWVWGVSWVYMFDMSQDMASAALNLKANADPAVPSLLPSKKRKRRDNGAGGPTRLKDTEGLLFDDSTPSKAEQAPAGDKRMANGGQDDSDDNDLEWEPSTNTKSADDADGLDQDKPISEEGRPKYWCTFKYRPIFGIVSIGEDLGEPESDTDTKRRRLANGSATVAEAEGVESNAVEVAIVERPVWDLDLPPRFEIRYTE